MSGFLGTESLGQLISSIIFYPLFVYFGLLIIPRSQKAVVLPKESEPSKTGIKKKGSRKVEKLKKIEDDGQKKFDMDRRAFLKMVGSAGTAIFIFSVFGIKQAQAAFFGSVPGPGVVGLKDASGTLIDPAEKHPTDGYKITELDDSTPAFYGFVNKDGEWFIMREDSAGAYRYTSGSSGFATNWTNRATLTYDYFDNIF